MDKPIYSKQINSVFLNPLISKSAKALYGVLCTYRNTNTNTCWPGNAMLSQALSSDRYMVAKWLKELVDNGVITIEVTNHYKNMTRQRIITFTHDYSDLVKSL